MVPKNIKSEHVLKALELIDQDGFPRSSSSSKFELVYNEKKYPPKYVISMANKFANGEEWSVKNFSGGTETNNFLTKLGFQITTK